MRHGSHQLLEVQVADNLARVGLLHFSRHGHALPPVQTPVLFPVATLITGTTPRGGGIWKFVLRRLFQEHSPMMAQALQFLDFDLTGPQLRKWTESPQGSILQQHLNHYQEEFPALGITDYRGPLFVDSGGFKFLGNRRPDLTRYGIADGRDAWRGILSVQESFGGDIYVSLDYPLKPGLEDDEAADLIQQSLTNALHVLRHLQARPGHSSVFFVPCHGRTYEEMQRTVQEFFARVDAEGLDTAGVGVGIGSLVPLRTVKKFEAIINIINGARNGIPEQLRERVPIHVFGVTGFMIPVLAYLGVDTFDSSSYIQHARTLDYYRPDRHQRVPFLEMEERDLPCDCPHCQQWPSYERMHSVLVGTDRTGTWKSEVYASLALHNLYWDNKLVEETRQAIHQGCMVEFLVDHARLYHPIRPAMDILARTSSAMNVLLSRQYFTMGLRKRLGAELELPNGPIDLRAYDPGPPPWARSEVDAADSDSSDVLPARRISLKYTPDSFIVPSTWSPAPDKDVLLVLPCSEVKPYRDSRSHQTVLTHLSDRLASVGRIQKVTLSGLYGPVPAEFEDEAAIVRYDFRLAPPDEAQIQLCVRRLVDFLRTYGERFALMVGYVTSRAYRDVMQRAAGQVPGFTVLPETLVKQQMTELYRREHLDTLATLIENEVMTVDQSIRNSVTA